MKRILIALLSLTGSMAMAAEPMAHPQATVAMAKSAPKADKSSNKEATLAVSRAIAAQELGAKAAQLLSKDFKYHGPAGMELETNGYVGFMAQLNQSFSDMKMNFTQVVEEGDMVGVHYTNTFVFTAPYNGIPANNKQVVMTGTFIRRIQNGKVAEEWDNPDLLGLMQQIGAIPAPGTPKH